MSGGLLKFHTESSIADIESKCDSLYMVGCVYDEEDGHQLLLCGSAGQATLIYSFSIKDRELKLLYSYANIIKNIVGISMDGWRSILAITTQETRQRDGVMQTFFKTSLAEVCPAGEQYRLNVRSQLIQTVEFVYEKKNPKTTVFLFFIHGAFIRLYQIYSRKRSAGGLKITTQPVMLSEIVKKFHWYQFDPTKNQLFVMLDKAGTNVLRCYRFPRTEKLIFEIALDVDIPKSMRSFGPFREFPFDGRTRTIAKHSISLISFENGGMCLCMQHLTGEITVFALHHNLRLDYPSQAPAYFCALGDLLAIYSPGDHLRLLDIGRQHAPLSSLVLEGPEFATPMSPVNAMHSFYMPPPVDGVMVGQKMLFDGTSGSILSFRLDASVLKAVFTLPSSILHTEALHMILVHMRDFPLGEFIVRESLQGRLNIASAEFFSEYLLASVHEQLLTDNSVPMDVVEVLPVSSLLSLTSEQEAVSVVTSYVTNRTKDNQLVFAARKMYDNSPVPEHVRLDLASMNSPERFKLRRRAGSRSNSPGNSGSLPQAAPPVGGGLSRVVQILFGQEEDSTAPLSDLDDDPELSSVCALPSRVYVEIVADELAKRFPKESRAKCTRWARIFRDVLVEKAVQLYKSICDVVPATDEQLLFSQLEYLYCALEDLNVPLPPGFATHFAAAGFHCLSKEVFMQYVDRKIFYLTNQFISRVLKSLDETEEDQLIRFQLLSRMRDVNVVVDSLWERSTDASVLMQYLGPRLHITPPKTDVGILEAANDSFFIPCTVYSQHVRVRGGPHEEAIQQHDERIRAFVAQRIKETLSAQLLQQLIESE